MICLAHEELSNYFKIYLNGKEVFNSREEANYEPWMVGFNINLYIDKDYNQNGKKELFIDAGISQGNNWSEQYYFFEYDKNSIKLVKLASVASRGQSKFYEVL